MKPAPSSQTILLMTEGKIYIEQLNNVKSQIPVEEAEEFWSDIKHDNKEEMFIWIKDGSWVIYKGYK